MNTAHFIFKPRNPLVRAGLMRRAGRHGPSNKSQRLAERRALRHACADAARHGP